MLAPPCSSFSIMNQSVSRSREDPWGTSIQPSYSAWQKIQAGNACARAAFKIINRCLAANIPWALEHPRSSRLWHTPQAKRLLQRPHVFLVHLDQCQFGTPWRKATSIMCGNVCEQDLVHVQKRCRPNRHHCCSRPGKRHVVLQGQHASGIPMTAIAAAYPPKLAQAIVTVLTSNLRATRFSQQGLLSKW